MEPQLGPPRRLHARGAASRGVTVIAIKRKDGRVIEQPQLAPNAKLNALTTALFQALDAHLEQLERAVDSIGCVVLQGAGRAFCVGADLAAIHATPPTHHQ